MGTSEIVTLVIAVIGLTLSIVNTIQQFWRDATAFASLGTGEIIHGTSNALKRVKRLGRFPTPRFRIGGSVGNLMSITEFEPSDFDLG